MCFINDCDWYAEVNEASQGTLSESRKCQECWQHMEKGQVFHRIYQQEHECCYDCENGHCQRGDLDYCCSCDAPNLGETFEHIYCDNCYKLLEAIRLVETDEGCDPSESSPPFSMMIEELSQFDNDQREAYFTRALAVFPGAQLSDYLHYIRGKTSSLRN